MAAWTIVPIRGLATGKSRLAPVLDVAARLRLSTRLLLNTLHAVESTFGNLQQCIVVSSDPAARTIATRRGARALGDPPGAGLDGALDAAREAARAAGATRLLVLSADMPDLDRAALQALLQCADPARTVLLADKCGTGTNGMLLPAGLPLAFAFGPGSLDRHRAALAGLGVPPACWTEPRLAFDIDTPADLAAWRRSAPATTALRGRPGSRTPGPARSPAPATTCAPPAGRWRGP